MDEITAKRLITNRQTTLRATGDCGVSTEHPVKIGDLMHLLGVRNAYIPKTESGYYAPIAEAMRVAREVHRCQYTSLIDRQIASQVKALSLYAWVEDGSALIAVDFRESQHAPRAIRVYVLDTYDCDTEGKIMARAYCTPSSGVCRTPAHDRTSELSGRTPM